MNSELVLIGKRISLASRSRRRWLVVFTYVGLAIIASLSFRASPFESFAVLFGTTLFVNGFFLGGDYLGGLVKPFSGKPRESVVVMSTPGHLLKWGFHRASEPGKSDVRNDERELVQRDRAHYKAYRILYVAIALPILVILDRRDGLHMFPATTIPLEVLLYDFLLAAWVLYSTLPQAILIWGEPDMEESK
jgi:hypothetical protein